MGCSFLASLLTWPGNLHLANHDVTFTTRSAMRSRPLQKANGLAFQLGVIQRQRLQLRLPRVFAKDEMAKGKVYYNYEVTDASTEDLPAPASSSRTRTATCSTPTRAVRGDERSLGTYMYLDITPKGRDENGPNYNWMVGEASLSTKTAPQKSARR